MVQVQEELGPVQLTKRLLVWEIVIVFALSLGGSALFAIIDLIASLTVNKSLNKQQALIVGSLAPGRPLLDLILQLANLLIGLPMYFLGAWPVLGFMGLDVWLLWYMFQRSYVDARRSETLTLTDRDVIVERRAPDGEREEHRLDAYWLRVELGERLVLISRGQRVVVGRFLSPVEREKLADELKAAHAKMRGR